MGVAAGGLDAESSELLREQRHSPLRRLAVLLVELHGLGERVEQVRPAGVVSHGVQPLALAHRGAVLDVTDHCLFLRIL